MRIFRPLLCAFALAAFAAPQASFADFARGRAAYEKKNYKLALTELEPEVKRGNAPSMYLVGMLYAEGKGVKRDDKRAFELFEKAAQGGQPGAQGMLAMFHAQGRATERNDTKSIEWARRAADNGDPLSQYMMGVRSREGWGVPKNPQEASVWFGTAAEQGYALAQYSLALLIGFNPPGSAEVAGTREQRVEAAKWLMLAAREKGEGLPDIGSKLAELKKKMPADEVRDAEELAKKWRPPVRKTRSP